jgi:hypothetical protein
MEESLLIYGRETGAMSSPRNLDAPQNPLLVVGRGQAVTEPHVTEYLADCYRRIREAIVALMQAAPFRDNPSNDWRHELRRVPSDAQTSILTYIEQTASHAASAARLHIVLLERAYWPNPINPRAEDPEDWPGESVYPPARAALESLAIVGWLMQPDVDTAERMRRTGELMLWSAPRDWRRVLEEAGVAVDRTPATDVAPPGHWFVKRDESSKPLTWTRMMEDVFGRAGASTYGKWSKLSHSDPKRTAELNRWTPRPGGGFDVKRVLREDEHLTVVADLADAASAAGIRFADYLGRPAFQLTTTCREISESSRRGVERAAAHIRAREQRSRSAPAS